MAKGYNVKLAPAFNDLWVASDIDARTQAEDMYKRNEKECEISREEYLASEIVKIMWRRANPMIVNYWAEAEEAFTNAIQNPGTVYTCGRGNRVISYKKSGSFLWCRLPSGGVLSYPYPEIKEVKTPWKNKDGSPIFKNLPTYMSEDGQSKKWMRFSTYGGSIVENTTQAVARDLLADAMLRLDKNGFDIVLHVHDEAACDMPKKIGNLNTMSKIMSETPTWAAGLPLKAEGFTSYRYRK
jgi:DNA polymerase